MTAETHPDRRADLVGSLLERRYRVDALIARGGMSSVYRGLDTRLDRPVALKVMDAQFSGDRSFTERFEREARAAARLHHPDVVAVYDQGVDRSGEHDHVYLVMQLVEGGTVRDLLRERGALPLPAAVRIMESVLGALAAAHEAGMVHRDVKPENVLIGRDGAVRVTDFGLVRAAASAGTTSGSVVLGTVAYLSPEQVTSGAADARTDVYAAGVVLYELLTGSPPYTGDTALSVAYRHVNDDVPAPSEHVPELPPAVDDLVLRATRRDPSVRPADAGAFLADLRRLRDALGLGPVAAPVPTGSAPTEPRQASADEDRDGPPTDRIAPVTAAMPAAPSPTPAPPPPAALPPQEGQDGGPQGTRALVLPPQDAEQTQELAAVGASPNEPDQKRTRRRGRRAVAISTVVVLVLAALVGGTAWWLGSGRYIAVPQVKGQPVEAAKQSLRGAELVPRVTRTYHNTVAPDTVISASPHQGERVLSGADVTLTVSKGRPRVPEISAGMSVRKAQNLLRNAKLQPKLDSSVDEFHNTVPRGRVIEVKPTPGSTLKISSPVTVVVSKGPPPVPVPDVRGKSRKQAFATLREAGFEPYVAGKKFADGVARDHVISMSPSAGTEVRMRGTPRVGVVVSNAVKVPNLSGMHARKAQQKLAELGLKLEVNSMLNRGNARIFGQLPLPGNVVKPGTTVTVTAL